jgi:hypothetical protein
LALKVKSTFVKALKENHFPERLSTASILELYPFHQQGIAQVFGIL